MRYYSLQKRGQEEEGRIYMGYVELNAHLMEYYCPFILFVL